MPVSKPIDIDALLADDFAAAEKAEKYVPVKLFGDTFRVSTDPNVYILLEASSGSPDAIAKMVTGMIHPDDVVAFRDKLMAKRGLTAETLMKVVSAMMEAAAERPTKSRAGSQASSRKTTVS